MKRMGKAVRNAGIAFVFHGGVAGAVLALDRKVGGANLGGWDGVRLLRALDFPALWAIDNVLQHIILIPAKWFDLDSGLSYAISLTLAYCVMGGAFYAAVVAGITMWFGTRRAAVAQLGSEDRGED